MLFNSLDFAIFFPVVFILYWLVAKNLTLRNVLIIVASYTFYGWWDWRFLSLIIISSLVDFFVAQKIYKAKNRKKRKALLIISLLVNLGFLVYFKYTNFFIEAFVDSFRLFGKELEVSTLNIILPVGISFYTFQTLSYTIDIYRKQFKPTKDWLSFFAFVAFFPQLVAGPIERASHLLPQFYKVYKFDYKRIKSGLLLMAFGLFKKMVIADRAAIIVNQVFNNVEDYAGIDYFIAILLFAFQIYCDFSGYSDIAIGIARTMGFDLMKNFDSPYFSKSITEFWRRWHISLSTWFRDYVYIPLGGSRSGKYRTYVNLFIVFLVSGLWHGAAMNFVIWGGIHGLIIVLEKATYNLKRPMLGRLELLEDRISNNIFFTVVTFIIVCFAWIFFRANSLDDAISIINGLSYSNYNLLFDSSFYFGYGVNRAEFLLVFACIFMLMVIEALNKKYSLERILNNQGFIFRWSIYSLFILSIILFGVYGDLNNPEFIYFQF